MTTATVFIFLAFWLLSIVVAVLVATMRLRPPTPKPTEPPKRSGPVLVAKPPTHFREQCWACGAVYDYTDKDVVMVFGLPDTCCPSCQEYNAHLPAFNAIDEDV